MKEHTMAKKVAKKAAKKVTKKAPAKKAAAKTTKKVAKKTASKRKPNAAFMRPLTPSAELAMIVGAKTLPRTEVVKKMWVYIKKNNLQDSVNRRMINADAAMKAVLGKPKVSMFDLTKAISKHLS